MPLMNLNVSVIRFFYISYFKQPLSELRKKRALHKECPIL